MLGDLTVQLRGSRHDDTQRLVFRSVPPVMAQ